MTGSIAFLGILVIALMVMCKNLIVTLKRVEKEKNKFYKERVQFSDDYFECLDQNQVLIKENSKLTEFLNGWQEKYSTLQEQNVELRVKVHQITQYLETGVFYDPNNDTIVVPTDLEKIGDL